MGALIVNLGPSHDGYLIVGLIMFFAGIYGFFAEEPDHDPHLRRTDSQRGGYQFSGVQPLPIPDQMEGMSFALFVIAIAACETAVAIAIIINVYRNFGNVKVDNIQQMKE